MSGNVRYVKRTNSNKLKHLGLLQPLPLPTRKWECISMNLIVEISRTQKAFDYIFAVVDRSTKVDQFIPTIAIVTTLGVVELFLEEIFVT